MLLEWNEQVHCYSSDEIDVDLMATEAENTVENQQYVKIEVRNPRTHISREKALYTDYEILVQTNNIAFASTESCVRRRYSDFQWLRNRLLCLFPVEKNLPELPPKRLFGRFKRQFLKHRQSGLQKFLEEITHESTYLSDIAVHLFLQTLLSVKEIEKKLNGTDSGEELIEVLQSPSTSRGRGLSRSSLQVDDVDDMNFDHDSGFYYSTASSINDGITPHTASYKSSRHVKSLSAAFDLEKVMDLQSTKQVLSTNCETSDVHKSHTSSCHSLNSDVSGHDGDSHCYTSSGDDDLFCSQYYDADDEIDSCICEDNNNNNEKYVDSSDEEDLLFCLRHDNQSTVYSLDRALEILSTRPKLTDRLYSQDESDDCFHESEYDVIDTEDDLDLEDIVNDESYPKASIPVIKIRAHSFTEGEIVDIDTVPIRSKNKLKIGKVKSLPNIRFPIRNQKKGVTRSYCYGISDVKSRTLKEVNEQEELTILSDNDTSKIDHRYLQASPSKLVKSESEGQQSTSDADYLTTIHKYTFSNDNHPDTNIDTQAEDVAPSKFYDFVKRRNKKRGTIQLLSYCTDSTVIESNFEQKGRFRVSVPNALQVDALLDSSDLPLCPTITKKETTIDDKLKKNGISTHFTESNSSIIIITGKEKKAVEIQDTSAIDPSDPSICLTLQKTYSIYPSTYCSDVQELEVIEETVSLQKTSEVTKRKESVVALLKSYDIISC